MISTSPKCTSLSVEERKMVLAGTRKRHGVHSNRDTIAQCLGTTKTSVNETEVARSFGEGPEQFILQKPTLNGMLSKMHTASREMHLSWRRLGPSIPVEPSGGVVCWTSQFLNQT